MFTIVQFLFLFFFTSITLFEGLGIANGRSISFLLIVSCPLLFLVISSLLKEKLALPRKLTKTYLVFLILMLLSTFFSIDKQRSFESLIYQTSLFFIFIFINNYKSKLVNIFIPSLIILTSFLSLYSLFLNLFKEKLNLFIPQNGYQYVYSVFGSHSHLGDLAAIVIVMTMFIYIKRQSVKYLLVSIFLFPFFLFSYSRSAYLSVFLTIILYLIFKKIKEKKPLSRFTLAYLCFTLLATGIFFMATITESSRFPILYTFNNVLTKTAHLTSKTFFAERLSFYQESFSSIKDKPLFGVGLNNFEYSSKKYTLDPFRWTASSHNIVLDFAVEGGVLGTFIYLLFLLLIIKQCVFVQERGDSITSKAMSLGLFSILIIFQTDYVYRLYSFYLIFFILISLTYSEKDFYVVPAKNLNLPVILLFTIFILITQSIYLYNNGAYYQSLFAYPLNKKSYEPAIRLAYKNSDLSLANKLQSMYLSLFPGNFGSPKDQYIEEY